jgi:hypothetical protein
LKKRKNELSKNTKGLKIQQAKPIQFEEFKPLIKWWNNRKESNVAWKVKV